MRNKIKWFFPCLAVLILASWPVVSAYTYSHNTDGQDTVRMVLFGSSAAAGLTNVQEPAYDYSNIIPKIRERVNDSAGEEFPFRMYVTPEDPVIKALAAQIDTTEDAYKVAVQWTYVTDQKLNHIADKWLTPHDFLTGTPDYPGNPLKGEEVSDCEEQVNTLASLMRAQGVPQEEVRVALGEVRFGDEITGHAWVELLIDGHWVALDPTCGPYWDDKAGKLVRRRGYPFNYYVSHTYPVLQVHAYYNDIYYLEPRDNSGNAPDSWYRAAAAK